MKDQVRILRITTVPISLKVLLKGQLRFMVKSGFSVYAASAAGKESADVVTGEGVPFYELPLTRTISPIKDIVALHRAVMLIKKLGPDIVHTHTPKAGVIGMLAAWICKVPIRMHTVAGLPLLESKGMKRLLLNVIERMTYAAATCVYPNSRGLYDIIIENKYTVNKKLKILADGSSNGINTAHFCRDQVPLEHRGLREKYGIAIDDFVYIFVGRIVRDKGIHELIAAFTMLGMPKVKLMLVGDFEHELDPLNIGTYKEIQQNQAIICTGYQNDVRPFFAIASALVFPSYREGFPNVVMQAGAMELPCIVSDINGCNEIIVHDVNGLIVQPKNTTALKDAMVHLVNDKEIFLRLKNAARGMITRRYEEALVWEAIRSEYLLLHKNV